MAPLDFNAPTKEEKAEIRRRKAAITRQIKREVMAEHGIDKLPPKGDRKLITGAQGTGKSRTVGETIAELPPMMRLKSADLPTFGRPTRATTGTFMPRVLQRPRLRATARR